jgi:integrase
MIEAGFSPKEVQVAAGHASITTTFDRYGHVMPGTLAGQRERLATLDARGERADSSARTAGSATS